MHECKICNKQYKTAGHLKRHELIVHSNIIYHCDICNKFSSKNRSGFSRHKRICEERQINLKSNINKDVSNTDIFIDNKYTKLYYKIVKSVTQKELEGYCENHHIIPKSLGGSDDRTNIIRFSARKHFLCHYLLTKMVKKNSESYYKMVYAFDIMRIHSTENRYINSKLFKNNRKEFSKAVSKSQSGKGNSQYGTMWIHNPETKENKKLRPLQQMPSGFIKGKYKIITPKKAKVIKLKLDKRKILLDSRIEKSKNLYISFIKGNYSSIREFCRSEHCDISIQALTKLWKKYVPLPTNII